MWNSKVSRNATERRPRPLDPLLALTRPGRGMRGRFVQLTTRLADAGELLGITVLDHLIVCERGFVSLRERGCIQ